MSEGRRTSARSSASCLPLCKSGTWGANSLAPIPLTTPWAVEPKTCPDLSGEWGQGNQRMGIANSGYEPQDCRRQPWEPQRTDGDSEKGRETQFLTVQTA